MTSMTPRPRTYRKRWNIHFCPFDRDCRRWHTPPRLTICTPWRAVGIAMWPSGRYFVGKGRLRWWITWR